MNSLYLTIVSKLNHQNSGIFAQYCIFPSEKFTTALSPQCTKKVIESSSPRFRNLTNSLYTPIVAMKYADETGGLSVHTFYNLLFNFGSLMHITMNILKCLTCSCLRRRTISPDWRGQQWDNSEIVPYLRKFWTLMNRMVHINAFMYVFMGCLKNVPPVLSYFSALAYLIQLIN